MVRIITDSAADFEADELDRMGVGLAPLSFILGDNEYIEDKTFVKDTFYELLKNEKGFPKTSQPSQQCFIDLLEEAKDSGDDTVLITISSGLSGTVQGATAVKNMLEYDNCYIVDSLTATGGERILVEVAVRLRDEGASAEEIVRELEDIRSRQVLYTCMDTLEFLYKGGRIPLAVYSIGSAARVKPIMHVSPDGHPAVKDVTLGLKRAIKLVNSKVEKMVPDRSYPFYVMYTDDKAAAEELYDYLVAQGLDPAPDGIVQVGAVVGSHIGTGACAVAYIQQKKA